MFNFFLPIIKKKKSGILTTKICTPLSYHRNTQCTALEVIPKVLLTAFWNDYKVVGFVVILCSIDCFLLSNTDILL